jgi:hypothetical protein
VAPVIGGVTIDTSADVAHSGVVSLKVDNFILESASTTTTRIGVIDNGSTVYWWHWCINHSTLFIWVYIPPSNWIPDLIGEYTVIIGGSRYYGAPTPLASGWNYLSIDAASTINAVVIPYTSQYATWLGPRITNMNSTTAFTGPFYVDDEGGAVPDGIWHVTDFETGLDYYYAFNWSADTVGLAVSSTQKYHGDASLALSFAFPYDATSAGHAINVGHQQNCSYNFLPYVGLRSYLYLPNPPPTTWVQLFGEFNPLTQSSWKFVNQPNIQQGWNVLGFDLSTCNIVEPSYIFSRMCAERIAIQIGKNTTAAWVDTVYWDDIQAVPAIQASISTVQISVGGNKNLAPYIEYGLPFNPFPGVYNWLSNNTTVVSVGAISGIINGLNVGSATITASDRTGMTVSIVVNVIATDAPLAVEPNSTVMQKREQFSPLFE